jgi:hypothetical protein
MIAALIVTVAVEFSIPPGFMLALATIENPTFSVSAVNINSDGTTDRGIMQLNSSWYDGDPYDIEDHLRQAAALIRSLYDDYRLNWWQVAVAYNCGIKRVLEKAPPNSSIEYANKVYALWLSTR